MPWLAPAHQAADTSISIREPARGAPCPALESLGGLEVLGYYLGSGWAADNAGARDAKAMRQSPKALLAVLFEFISYARRAGTVCYVVVVCGAGLVPAPSASTRHCHGGVGPIYDLSIYT